MMSQWLCVMALKWLMNAFGLKMLPLCCNVMSDALLLFECLMPICFPLMREKNPIKGIALNFNFDDLNTE